MKKIVVRATAALAFVVSVGCQSGGDVGQPAPVTAEGTPTGRDSKYWPGPLSCGEEYCGPDKHCGMRAIETGPGQIKFVPACLCENGYVENGTVGCRDFDECTESASFPCASYQECVNTPGSYSCTEVGCNATARSALTAKQKEVAAVVGLCTGGFKSLETGCFLSCATGSVFYSSSTGAYEVHGDIRSRYLNAFGGTKGFLGYPTTDETATPDGIGRYNHFQNGSIYWAPETGAHEVHGAIRQKWAALGWELSYLGYPTTDETATPDGVGRYNHFQGGSIYYHPTHGTHALPRGLVDAWSAQGWETGPFGYPVGDASCDGLGVCTMSFEDGALNNRPNEGMRYCTGDSLTGRCFDTVRPVRVVSSDASHPWYDSQMKSFRVQKGWTLHVCSSMYANLCTRYNAEYAAITVSESEINSKNLKRIGNTLVLQPANLETATRVFRDPSNPNKRLGFAFVKGTAKGGVDSRRVLVSLGATTPQALQSFVFFNATQLSADVSSGVTAAVAERMGDIEVTVQPGTTSPMVAPSLKVRALPSFAMSISTDSAMNGEGFAEHMCNHTVELLVGNGSAIVDCRKPGTFSYLDVDVSGGFQFRRKTDDHDLVWVQGHGSYDPSSGTAILPISKGGSAIWLRGWFRETAALPSDTRAGDLNMTWFLTGACKSMGYDAYIANWSTVVPAVPMQDVIRVTYSGALQRLHGVGGIRNNAVYQDGEDFPAHRFGDYLNGSYILSDVFIYQLYRSSYRDPRFVTREEKDCAADPNGTYMFGETFKSRWPDKQKDYWGNALPKYRYYCHREMTNGSYVTTPYLKAFPAASAELNLQTTAKAMSQFAAPERYLGNRFLNPDRATFEERAEGATRVFENQKASVSFAGRSVVFHAKRGLVRLSDRFGRGATEFAPMFKERALEVARSLTTAPLELYGTAEDTVTSFEDHGTKLEELGKAVNRVTYFFRPVIGSIPVDNADIKVTFDAEGLAFVESDAPASLEKTGDLSLKGKDEVASEIAEKLGMSARIEFKNVRYVLDDDGNAIPVYLQRKDNHVHNIPLEAE